jgi:cytosine/adenosine deaminase-related metal-dependent hydrolase
VLIRGPETTVIAGAKALHRRTRVAGVPMETLIRGGTIVTCDAKDRVETGDVLVRDGVIVALGPDARRSVKGPSTRALDATGCAVIPGFVQGHVHLCQVLFRGMADDLPLLDWLKQRIWPLEAAHDEASLAASADLGLLEMLRGGTTTILDMGTVRHHDVVFEAMARAGVRGFSGKTMMDAGEGVPRGLRENTRESLRESDRLAASWHGAAKGRLGYAYAPRFVLSCSEKLIRETAAMSESRKGTLVHTHAAEHPGEKKAVRAILGRDDVDALAEWGVTGPNTILAHGVQLTATQRKAVARAGTRVVHCPSANLKLGSGIAQVHAMRKAGIVMGLGADGAPCNNNLDALVELRHAALLAKIRSGTTTLPAPEALRLATIDGARALGIDAVTGSLEIGKRADIAVIDLSRAHCEPGGDAITRLVYAAQTRDVRHVMVDGREVVRRGEMLTLDEDRVLARARDQARKLVARAGI